MTAPGNSTVSRTGNMASSSGITLLVLLTVSPLDNKVHKANHRLPISLDAIEAEKIAEQLV
jgi:hypothetical protein